MSYYGPPFEVKQSDPTLLKADVYIQDQTTPIVDWHLTKLIQALTLVSSVSIDDLTATVSSVGTPVAGSIIEFYEGTRFFQAEILTVVANASNWDLGQDTPIDFAFTTGATLKETSPEMAVDGSVTTQIFDAGPSDLQDGEYWDITRITLQMTHNSAGDDGLFGNQTKLTKGIVLRATDGITKTYFNAKDNGQLALHSGGDVVYPTRSGGGGTYGTRARRTFSGQDKNGVTVRVGSTENGKFQILIQDDLTGLLTGGGGFQAVMQGHVVE